MDAAHISPILWILALFEVAGIVAVVLACVSGRSGRWRYAPMSRRKRTVLLAMTVASFVLCLFAAALEAGYGEPLVGSKDSAGNELGYQLPLTWELCRAMLANASSDAIVSHLGWFGGLFLFMHLLLAGLLAGADRIAHRASAAIAWLQLVLFPTGGLGLIVLPFVTLDCLRGKLDPEALCEPPLWWTFQPLWLLTAVLSGVGWLKASGETHRPDRPRRSTGSDAVAPAPDP